MNERKRLGWMWLATMPCGRFVAGAWEDGWPDVATRPDEWRAAGFVVTRVERFAGDPLPELACSTCIPNRACKTAPERAEGEA